MAMGYAQHLCECTVFHISGIESQFVSLYGRILPDDTPVIVWIYHYNCSSSTQYWQLMTRLAILRLANPIVVIRKPQDLCRSHKHVG